MYLKCFSCCITFALLAAPLFAAERPVNFARDIKPILASKCFACHGPDEPTRKAELRLDTREGALESAAIEPGSAAQSELVARVTSTNPKMQMPPPDAKKPGLTAAEIALVKRWIDAGAKYDAHWSYVTPEKHAPPQIADTRWQAWTKNPIDQFLLAEQLDHGLQPAKGADKRTLIRRLSLDLTGLPPTPEEVEAFVNDGSPQAYEKLVDRLLESPHYGERMAMFWLDLVRFADTSGYHSDNHRDVAPYRDWVIAAFQQNMPFDRFTVEQLAGDLLPMPTNDQKIASGYNRLLQTTEEGGAQAKEYTAKYLADRVRNASNVWMGATLGCAECHNHKFDPYTAKDFYRMGAFFADIQEKAVGRQDQVKIPSEQQNKQLAKIKAELAALQSQLEQSTPTLVAGQAKWEVTALADLAANRSTWNIAKPAKLESTGKQTLTVQDDLSVLASGENPAKDTYVITLPLTADKVTGVRLEALTHDSLTNKSLSRGNGNFVLTEVEVAVVAKEGEAAKPVKIVAALADFSQDGHPVQQAIDGNNATGWAVNGHQAIANRTAVFKLAEAAAGAQLIVRLKHDSQYGQHNIGRFRLSLTSIPEPSLEDKGGVPGPVAAVLQVAADKRTEDQKTLLAKHYRTIAPELASLRDQIAKLTVAQKSLGEAAPQTLITQAGSPREVRILPRGDWLNDSGEVVEPGVPEFLGSLNVTGRRATRLDLAEWLVAKENPMVARVFVNRLWKLMFGHGLARNMEDYGTQGSFPTHPELLDTLAVEFRDGGWNIRQLLKQMAMSSAYQQASSVDPETRAKDPLNQWLARQDRYRLDAEFVRDNALAISGLLSNAIGGPSVKPYQPEGHWQFLNFPARTYQNDHGDSLYRRGMYTYWQRSFINPSLMAFDAPSREECTNERSRSNTPLQALALLNDPTYVEAARALATKTLQNGGATPEARIDFAFRRATSRPATVGEIKLLAALYAKHRAEFTADPAKAADVLTTGESVAPKDLDPVELAAWTSVMRVILNLHETVTRS